MTSVSLHVGQFLLGPKFVQALRDWRQFAVMGTFVLMAHSDLPVIQLKDEKKQQQLTLIGHLLDPRSPTARNEDVLRSLLARFRSRTDLIDATAGLGGRWVLMAESPSDRFMFHDALGLRQVFYTDPRVTGELWAMSQPGIGTQELGFDLDSEAKEFMDSYAFRSHSEFRWPGAASPVRGMRHLLPNHVLDLKSGIAERYWPASRLVQIGANQAIEELSGLLPGMVQAAGERHDLALGITAGLDSRLVLAAARPVKHKIAYVTVRQAKMPDNHPDLTVPARLLNRLGLTHEVIRAPATMSPEFSYYFKRNVFLAHDHYGPDAEAILRYFGRKRAALTGSGAEVGRLSFRKQLPWWKRRAITPIHLAWLQRMEGEPFASNHFGDWLDGMPWRNEAELLDLFEWEQGHGNWLAMTQLEFDTAWREIITPFNCREVLITLLRVDERHRRAPNHALFRRLIETLWPGLLQEPINPQPRRSLLQLLKGTVRSLPKYWI